MLRKTLTYLALPFLLLLGNSSGHSAAQPPQSAPEEQAGILERMTVGSGTVVMALDVNREFDSDTLRYTYTSMVTPRTTYDYDSKTNERKFLKREPVLGGYDPAKYATEFAWATARDGTKVPVSIES